MDMETEQFDLESYIANYSGHNKLSRLLFIAEKRANTPLELEALKLAHDEVKKTENTQAYVAITQRIANRLEGSYKYDKAWVDAVERRAALRQERLETELQGHKANLIKESIRLGHNDLGDFYYQRGDLQNALKLYVRSRDYCTTPRHILTLCMNVIRTALELANFIHVANYVSKAETTPDIEAMDPLVHAKLSGVSGLIHLHNRRYKLAASKLVDVSGELGSAYNDVLAPQDVATYAALCALATFPRDDLARRLVNNMGFKELMASVPEVRELVMDFYACRYARCLRSLASMAPQLALDPHLAEHLPALQAQIRKHALVQYTLPFSSVNLDPMAAAFHTSPSELIKELAGLIMEKEIAGRIDAHARVLYSRRADARTSTYTQVMAGCQDYLRETKAALLRAKLLQYDFMQKPQRQGRGGLGGGGGEAGGNNDDGPSGPGGYPGLGRASSRASARFHQTADDDAWGTGISSMAGFLSSAELGGRARRGSSSGTGSGRGRGPFAHSRINPGAGA
ncbi:26S proteasome subunit RPN7-domain-containing protein [Haematococcus lacustris]